MKFCTFIVGICLCFSRIFATYSEEIIQLEAKVKVRNEQHTIFSDFKVSSKLYEWAWFQNNKLKIEYMIEPSEKHQLEDSGPIYIYSFKLYELDNMNRSILLSSPKIISGLGKPISISKTDDRGNSVTIDMVPTLSM